MNINGKEYTDGSIIEFANYDHYPVDFKIDPEKSNFNKLQKGIVKFDYRNKQYKFGSWNKVGIGEKEWFITVNGTNYYLNETNILNGNNKIAPTKHNILVENEEVAKAPEI